MSVSFGSVHSISLVANSEGNNTIERILAPFCHEIHKTYLCSEFKLPCLIALSYPLSNYQVNEIHLQINWISHF